MLNDKDQKLIADVNSLLAQGMSLADVARIQNYSSLNALYQRIYRLGYRVECERRLVCIHDGEAAA
jgi:hypothetical protein